MNQILSTDSSDNDNSRENENMKASIRTNVNNENTHSFGNRFIKNNNNNNNYNSGYNNSSNNYNNSNSNIGYNGSNNYAQRQVPKYTSSSKTSDINGIIRIFAILLLIFGICMIGSASYAIYQSQNQKNTKENQSNVVFEPKSDSEVLVKAQNTKGIKCIKYRWNDDEENVVDGNNGVYLETTVQIPAGQCTLHVVVVDVNGEESQSYDKDYDFESEIQIEKSGSKVKITDSRDTKIKYMTYRWDDEDETKVDVDSTSLSEEIDVKSGKHKLTVCVVDENNNTDTKTQEINGVYKPEVSISLDDTKSYFVIHAKSDGSKIKQMSVVIDQDESKGGILDLSSKNLNEFTYTMRDPYKLHPDTTNYIKVTVINEDGVSAEAAIKYDVPSDE